MAGKVILVGAGPGDAGLLTLKGRKAIERADVVVFDRLVDGEILDLIPERAQRIDVGKRAADHPVPQREINRILLEKAQEGKNVVRLKGGDCFVFGRGGEELELLAENGIDFEVIPGITSALAAAAYAGVPATHRDFCSSVHIITGHKKRNEALTLDFDALVRVDGTLIFLMAVASFCDIAQGLMSAGMPVDMPCAIVENGTRPEQRRLLTTVGGAEKCVAENHVVSPAIFVVGRVCTLSDRMDWFDSLPLKGVRVLVAKPRQDSHRLTNLLRERGARVIELPAPGVAYLPFELPEDRVNLILSSAESVDALFDHLQRKGQDARALAGYPLVCATQDAEKALTKARLIRDQKVAGLQDVRLCREDEEGLPVWRRVLPEKMELPEADFVALTTLGGAEAFAAISEGQDISKYTAVCIGERTMAAAQKLGMRAVQAAQPTMESMIECMIGRMNQ